MSDSMKQHKRLFGIKDSQGRDQKVYFSDKMEAKELRTALNEEGKYPPYHVCNGPDHMGKHGHRVPRMRRQPKCA